MVNMADKTTDAELFHTIVDQLYDVRTALQMLRSSLQVSPLEDDHLDAAMHLNYKIDAVKFHLNNVVLQHPIINETKELLRQLHDEFGLCITRTQSIWVVSVHFLKWKPAGMMEMILKFRDRLSRCAQQISLLV